MNRVLLGVRGLSTEEAALRVMETLKKTAGVSEVNSPHPGQIEVVFDPTQSTVMDLLRAVRAVGFLAGML
ncbi:MAG: heavy-metal-associated domain-containing protein [Deinococcales bacterium]